MTFSKFVWAAAQAVVNEKTDDAVTHQQLLVEMAEQADRADTLSRSLIDKESALGDLERKLEVKCKSAAVVSHCVPSRCVQARSSVHLNYVQRESRCVTLVL